MEEDSDSKSLSFSTLASSQIVFFASEYQLVLALALHPDSNSHWGSVNLCVHDGWYAKIALETCMDGTYKVQTAYL